MSPKTWIFLAALALLLLFILCPWMHWQSIAGVAPVANTNTNANVALGAPSLKIVFENGKYRLTGTLPNEDAKKQIIAKATEVYGAGNFIDELKVGGVSNPAWLACSVSLIQFTKTPVTNGSLSADGSGLTLRGEVPKQEDKDKINADANKACPPNSSIINAINVSGQNALSDEQIKTQGKLNDAIKGKTVEFATGSAELTDVGKATLDGLIPILKDSTDNLEIDGHTDNAGKAPDNISLSQRRAEKVKNYFIAKGLDGKRFSTKGYGQANPIAGTVEKQTPEEMAKNRRIEFQVMGGEK